MAALSPKSDPQRDRVYRMEHKELAGHYSHKVTQRSLRLVTKLLCKVYDLKRPTVIVRAESDYRGSYDPETTVVRLDPQQGRNYLTLCHELAHYVVHQQNPKAHDHGPTWMRVYTAMLDAVGIMPKEGMRVLARRYKIRIG